LLSLWEFKGPMEMLKKDYNFNVHNNRVFKLDMHHKLQAYKLSIVGVVYIYI
jgi:hypothetical protein